MAAKDDQHDGRLHDVVTGAGVLLAYQLIGEVIVVATRAPVPGPVVGMLALFVSLCVRGGVGRSVEMTAAGLLRYFPLLFVPAGVGTMLHAQRLASEWLALGTAVVLSTLISLTATALVMQALSRRSTPPGTADDERR